jgi:hypothetical protein
MAGYCVGQQNRQCLQTQAEAENLERQPKATFYDECRLIVQSPRTMVIFLEHVLAKDTSRGEHEDQATPTAAFDNVPGDAELVHEPPVALSPCQSESGIAVPQPSTWTIG